MKQVAVIIPVYNTSATLERCVDSVLAQTMPASEIILVDDGSPDDAGALADSLALKHPCIHVVHKTNAGLAEARHTGVKAATAPLVMHLDSDDTLPPDAIEFLHGKLTEHDLDIAYGCYMRIPMGGKPHEQHHKREGVMTGEQFVEQNLSLGALNSACCNMSLRQLWTDDVFPPAHTVVPSEDTITTVCLGLKARRVGQWNHPAYNYYETPGSLTVTGRLSQLDRWKQYFTLMEDILKRHGVLDRYRRHLHILKVDRLAFYVKDLDLRDPWVKAVVNDHTHASLPRKTRLLQRLLRTPSLLHALINLNRRLKRKKQ